MKKTVFVFIYGYLPGENYGGPVTSIYNLVENFHQIFDFRIVCSNHDHGKSEVYSGIDEGWNRIGNANVWYLSEKDYTKKNFERIIEGFDVSVIYLTGVFSYVLNHSAISVGKKRKIPVLIATRGEICRNVLAMKKYKKLPYLWVMRRIGEFQDVSFQVTSEEEKEQLIKYLGIDDSRIIYLPNLHGVQYNIEHKYKECESAKLVFISRIHPKKNLLEAIKAVNKAKCKVSFDIFGPIEDERYWYECQELIKKEPSNVEINYCGALAPGEAGKKYFEYDAFLFPTLTENYGHVIIESLLSGCPVIISKGTTPWDDADLRAGYVAELHNIEAFTEAIEKVAMLTNDELIDLRESISEYLEGKLDTDGVKEKYISLFEGKNDKK